MIKLFHVWRHWVPEHRYLVATLIDKESAENFVRQCDNSHWNYEVQESFLATYGMTDNVRDKLIQSVNSTLSKGVN